MKVLCNLSLGDIKVKDKLIPLSKINFLSEIFVVRKKVGPVIRKVKYCPVYSNLNEVFKYIKRIYILIYNTYKERPDVMIGYLFFPHGLASLLIGKIFRKKNVVSLISGPIELVTIRPRKNNHIDYNINNYELSKYILRIINLYDEIVVTGSYTKNKLIEGGINKDKIHIVPNVVDIERFNTDNISNKDIDLLILSYFTAQKGIFILTEAIMKYLNNNENIIVYIIGDGQEKGKVIESIRKNNMEKRIILKDITDRPEDYFQRSKFFLFSSKREGMPSTVIESMNCGCIPIMYPCGDIMDLVKDRYNGILYNEFTVDMIYSTLESLKSLNIEYIRNNAINTSKKLNYQYSSQCWSPLLEKYR